MSNAMDLQVLKEIGEYAALGFFEAESAGLPYPRAYGLAYRRLYEYMPVRVDEKALLTPFEPYYDCTKSCGDAMGGGWRSGGIDGAHHAVSYILNPFHSSGLEIDVHIAEEKKGRFPRHTTFIDALVGELQGKIAHRHGYIHSNPDILLVLEKGFDHHKRLIAEGIAAARAEKDDTGLHFLLAMEDFAKGIDAHFQTISAALAAAAASASGARKEKLTIIRDEFSRCFYKPADSFVGGLLTVNLLWMLDGCDSIGRIDYALGDLFDRDIQSGRLDLAFARELLDDLWRAFEAHNGWNLQIGGRTPGGGLCYNKLTRECLRCDARNPSRRPNLALRVSRDMPDDVMELALDSIARGTGKPALYNDDLYIQALCSLFPELTQEDAAQYGFGGCTETMIPGLSCVDSLAGSVNLAWLLGLALNDGIDMVSGERHGPQMGTLADFDTFDALFEAYKAQIDECTKNFAQYYNDRIAWRLTQGDPKIVRSMFTRDCLQNRRSFEARGARYNWAVVSYDGSTVAIDSLSAIKILVYEQGILTKEELYAALKNDFEGYEDVRQRLLAAPKFGNDADETDEIGAELLRYTWSAMLEHRTPRGGRFVPSVILFATYEHSGRGVAASANGRGAGMPLNDSIGAFEGADRHGPTALINSVLKLPHALAPGTPILNIRFSKDLIDDRRGRDGVKHLIKTYFGGGGLQMQVTVLSTQEMRAAQKEPEKYGGLIVRIGGYSERFVYLSPGLQETVIARAEH